VQYSAVPQRAQQGLEKKPVTPARMRVSPPEPRAMAPRDYARIGNPLMWSDERSVRWCRAKFRLSFTMA
jgi:hypothetical protein